VLTNRSYVYPLYAAASVFNRMSFFTTIVKNVKEFYSEINAATLTGAIDVIVIQAEDGSFRSSPFHVRFGKLGVLKAREKIVDLEINGEPVTIQMKLDDNGAAFFVEEVEEEDWSPDLATSPIPSSSSAPWQWREENGPPVPNPLVEDLIQQELVIKAEVLTDTGGEDERDEGRKGKLNKKKRRRRKELRHSRKGSKTSLKEIIPESEQDMFLMDDVNDAEDEKEKDETTPGSQSRPSTLPRNLSLEFADSFRIGESSTPINPSPPQLDPLGQSAPLASYLQVESGMVRSESKGLLGDELSVENSLIGSRVPLVPKSSSEAEALEQLLNSSTNHGDLMIGLDERHRPKSVSASFHYFSDTELERQSTPLHSRPATPTSDSEIERNGREEQTSWRWGELPSPYQTSSAVSQATEEDEKKKNGKKGRKEKREGSLLGWFRTAKEEKEEEKVEEKGMYLDDLMSADPQTAAIYLAPSAIQTNDVVDTSQQDPLQLSEVTDISTSESILPDSPEVSDVLPQLEVTTDIQPLLEPEEVKCEPLEVVEVIEDSGHIAEEVLEGGVEVPRDDDCESGRGPSLPMSPHSGHQLHQGGRARNFNSDSEDDLPGVVLREFPDFAASLCGGLSDEKSTTMITPEKFMAHILNYSDFVNRLRDDKSLLSNPSLVVRIQEKYMTWTMAAPLILSVILYKEPLPSDLSDELTAGGQSVNLSLGLDQLKEESKEESKKASSSWFGWFGSGSSNNAQVKTDKLEKLCEEEAALESAPDSVTAAPTGVDQAPAPVHQPATPIKHERRETEPSSSDDGDELRRLKKTLRLDSEQLAKLNLRPGSNEAQFSVTTAFQGTTRCKCHIYLWKHTDKVVISDIDGTITKSDVLGHILPVIGRNWAQSGVAQLFTKIKNNGYHIMYLSARAIGQASITKDYLQSVKQGDVCLPDGPMFLNPDSLIHAFRKEVIDRNPEEFKIRCLKDIQSLFPGRNPFFAGYGNRPNDAYAYRAVGIPVSRIFTINPAGELRHELTQNFQTSYGYQSEIADQYFPPMGKDGFDPDFKLAEFSDFGFWKETMPDIGTPELEDIKIN